MGKPISSLLVEEKWASVIWIWVPWLVFGSMFFFKQVSLYLMRDAYSPKPSSLESIVRVLKCLWQHEWVQMAVQHTPVPSRLTKSLCQSSNSQQQIGIYLSQVFFFFFLLIMSYAAALSEWSICLILGVGWGGCVVFSIFVWYYRFLKIVLQWKI